MVIGNEAELSRNSTSEQPFSGASFNIQSNFNRRDSNQRRSWEDNKRSNNSDRNYSRSNEHNKNYNSRESNKRFNSERSYSRLNEHNNRDNENKRGINRQTQHGWIQQN